MMSTGSFCVHVAFAQWVGLKEGNIFVQIKNCIAWYCNNLQWYLIWPYLTTSMWQPFHIYIYISKPGGNSKKILLFDHLIHQMLNEKILSKYQKCLIYIQGIPFHISPSISVFIMVSFFLSHSFPSIMGRQVIASNNSNLLYSQGKFSLTITSCFE